MKARTRFAPSPTGYLHVGGVRTALFAWLVARQSGGQFILRIEDTDRSRHVEESERHITESLGWLGLDWDEGPVRQSERLPIYREWAEKLIGKGRAYADPRLESELEKLRADAKIKKKPFLIREYPLENHPSWKPGVPLRFRSEPKEYAWKDEVMGRLSASPEAVDDYILIKSDGFPTYNFAHVVDDYLMNISHVIRSQEFLPSIPRFLNLYEALGLEVPKLATLPYVLGPDGKKKLSKRDGAKDILDYRREGYLPEALISFLATLGWNDGSRQEIFSRDELTKKFDLGRVQRSGAKFDERRLVWADGYFIRQKPLDELYGLCEGFWPDEAGTAASGYKKSVLGLVQERLKFLGELAELSHYFFTEPSDKAISRLFENPTDKRLKDVGKDNVLGLLKAARTDLQDSDFSETDITKRLNGQLEKLDTSPGVLFAIIRIAATGAPASPEIAATLNVLGKQKSLGRLDRAITLLQG